MELKRAVVDKYDKYITLDFSKPFSEQRTIVIKNDISNDNKKDINIEVLQRFSTLGNYCSIHIEFNNLDIDLNKFVMLINEKGEIYNFNKEELLLVISALSINEDYLLCSFSNYKLRLCKNDYNNDNENNYKYRIDLVNY